jgi:hypothetical protein
MLVAVVTPYFKESTEILKRCHDSVKAQTHSDVLHIMVSDGHPNPEVDNWDVVHVKIPACGDYGDTPRAIAGLIASNRGAEAITLLDADNYFATDHIETLLHVQKQTGVQVVTGTRTLIRMDGTVMGVDAESEGVNFNDTNCYLVMKPAFAAFSSWGFKDPREGITGDRVFWDTIKRAGFTRAHCSRPTTNYVTSFAYHYQVNGEEPPPGAKVIVRFTGEPYSRMIGFDEYKVLTQPK